MVETFKIQVNPKLYIRDPETSELGRRIISESIRLIDEIGFEGFTFKKLAASLQSTEATIYRYFENKHKLLVYLINWYWSWLELQLVIEFSTMNNAADKLKAAIALITGPIEKDERIAHIDEVVLHRIVIQEYAKAYLTKNVDYDNREGYFMAYKSLCQLMASLVIHINPAYPYPHSIMSTVLEASVSQQFFARHLPRLTDVNAGDTQNTLRNFIEHLVLKTIQTP